MWWSNENVGILVLGNRLGFSSGLFLEIPGLLEARGGWIPDNLVLRNNPGPDKVPALESSLMELWEFEDEYPCLVEAFSVLYYDGKVALTSANGTGHEKKVRPCPHGEWKKQVFW